MMNIVEWVFTVLWLVVVSQGGGWEGGRQRKVPEL